MKMKNFILIILSVFIINISYSQKETNDSKAALDACFQMTVGSNPIPAGSCVSFSSVCSQGGPTYWKWSFPGGEPEIIEGVGTASQSPSNICYYTPGTYDVILEVQNSTGIDTEVCVGCVEVEETGVAVANFSASERVIPVGTHVTFTNTSLNPPFTETNWSFQGGAPNYSTGFEPPVPILYNTIGCFDVQLHVAKENGEVSDIIRTEHICVVPVATKEPIADFEADRTFINLNEFVNFTDMSQNNPYKWEWTFTQADPASFAGKTGLKNPTGIQYKTAGNFQVRLVVWNGLGVDTIIKTAYIRVAAQDPCLTNPNIPEPIADFEARNRLIPAGEKVFFQDRSQNYPTIWSWTFTGGYPTYSAASNVTRGVEYNTTGFYDVYLAVNDACGRSSYILKEDYVMVFSGPVAEFCDTISNVNTSTEILYCPPVSNSWGYISGNNGQKTISYAEKFDQYQFDFVHELVMSVNKSVKLTDESYVTFKIWDGSTALPEIELASKKVLIKDIPENFWANIVFDSSIEVNGPFYAGYSINYAGGSNTAVNNSQFAIGLVNRGNNPGLNTFYIQNQDSAWISSYNKYGTAYSSSIGVKSCLVDLPNEEFANNIEIYPNPTVDNIYIQTGDLQAGKELFVQVYDITGKAVYQKKFTISGSELEINLKNCNTGLYLMSMIIDNNKISRKILINK